MVKYSRGVDMKDINRFTYGRTSVFNLNYHIIWGTKYRNKVLKGEVEIDLKKLLYEIANEYGFTIDHMEIGLDDHIHLLVNAPPKLSVTNIVRWLKGISARKLFQLHPELKNYYWKLERERQLWSPSYFVESIGTTNQDAVAKYIDDQREKEMKHSETKGYKD